MQTVINLQDIHIKTGNSPYRVFPVFLAISIYASGLIAYVSV